MAKKAFGKKDANQKNVETSLIEQYWYPKFGPGQLWEQVGREVEHKGGTLCMQHTVKRLLCKSGRITAVVCDTPEGETVFEGDVFVSSMPLKDLVCGIQDCDPEVQALAMGLPYRDFVTVGLLVDRLNLKNETVVKTLGNIVPDCWIYVQEPDVKLGRIQIFNNWSPYMVRDPEHTVWIGLEYFCDEGDDFWNLDDEACIHFAAAELEKMGVITANNVKDACRKRVKKAYPAYFDSYAHIGTIVDCVNGYENLYCIGRNGQHRYNNMDHSMLTAIYAANAIKAGRTDKTDIWNVNTEREYHEQKHE